VSQNSDTEATKPVIRASGVYKISQQLNNSLDFIGASFFQIVADSVFVVAAAISIRQPQETVNNIFIHVLF
jgi:hypothetical protein